MRILKTIIKKKHKIFNEKKERDKNYYLLSETCQIPNLANIYELFLGIRENGFFVDVGSYDGEYASNTSGLADFGWNGLCIEPVSIYYNKCKKRHKNNAVKVIRSAVGENNGSVDIYIGGPLSTIKKELVNKFNSMGWAKEYHHGKKEKVTMKKLDDLLIEEKAPRNFDVLSIDVEGYEWEILKNFDIKMWMPKIVIVELHDNNINYKLEWENCNKIVDYFDKNNYRIVFKDFTNTVYIKEDSLQV
jgi:FkbM family methyltransferase